MGDVVSPIVIEKGLQATFLAAYQARVAFWPRIATEVPSTTDKEKYGWLGSAPTMREWEDERVPKGLLDHDYTIKNKDWESTIAVDRNAFKDDQIGAVQIRIRDLAERAKVHPNSLVSTLIIDGESTLCYDGQFFFDTDHVEGESGTQSNDLTYNAADPNAVTQAEFALAFEAARKTLADFKDDRGEPFHEDAASGIIVMVPSALWAVSEATLKKETLATGETNVHMGAYELIVNPYLTTGTKFYLFKTDTFLKPVIFQNREPIKLMQVGLKEGDDVDYQRFMRKHMFFGAEARYNVGYGLWQNAVLTLFN
ncbi:Mu-like prophage major head subunit gpT family protein [Nitrospinae bacterium AH_259_B05_G02_I21]|nr:Mu-like prophage major head subunit gpT family protein [Nitrospinae bacterium AH_259_B05_G02_I21]